MRKKRFITIIAILVGVSLLAGCSMQVERVDDKVWIKILLYKKAPASPPEYYPESPRRRY